MLSAGIIRGMDSANDRRRYIVTSSLIGRTHTQNDPYKWPILTLLTRDEIIDIRSVVRSPTIASFTSFVWRNAFDNAISSQAHYSGIIWASHNKIHHDNVIKWKHFPRYWPFVHKGQWRGALMFSLICARINGWVNNCEAGDLRRHRVHYDITVMTRMFIQQTFSG